MGFCVANVYKNIVGSVQKGGVKTDGVSFLEVVVGSLQFA